MEPKTRNILLAAVAGVALAYFFSRKDKKKSEDAAVVDPNAKFLGVGGDVGGRSFGGPSKNYMPTENAANIQKVLNTFSFSGFEKLDTGGKFGPLSYAYLKRALEQFAAAAQSGKAQGTSGLIFLKDPFVFFPASNDDTISFDLMGGDTMTVRKSLYDKLSNTSLAATPSGLATSAWSAADARVYNATPSTRPKA